MKPKGPILSFATLPLVYHTLQPCGHKSVSHHACPCKRNAASETQISCWISQDPACFVLPRASWCWDAQTCCCVNPRASSCLVMLSTWRTIHFACGSFMQCWPWLYKSNLASQTDKSINWYPMLRFWQAAFLSSYNSLVEAGKGFRHQHSRVNLWDLTGKEV